MPGESEERLTVSVGKREFEDLTGALVAYTEATQANNRPVDPVLAMQRTGTVLQCLQEVFSTLGVEPKKSGEGRGDQ
jgi:hypothetical protein